MLPHPSQDSSTQENICDFEVDEEHQEIIHSIFFQHNKDYKDIGIKKKKEKETTAACN